MDTRTEVPLALTIAGSDPSGGAGLQADLKTFHQHRVYGMAVVTVVTVQSTRSVAEVVPLDARVVDAQLGHLLEDVTPGAAKSGALGTAELVEVLAARAASFRFPLVVDPVMVSKHGHRLVADDAVDVIRRALLPVTTLLTPNAHEAEVLLGWPVRTREEAVRAARALAGLGPKGVLLKGGHLEEGAAVDVLVWEGAVVELDAPRVDTPHSHGTGCTLSAAITAWLAQGVPVVEAVRRAKAWLTRALADPPRVGSGVGPVNHLAPVEPFRGR